MVSFKIKNGVYVDKGGTGKAIKLPPNKLVTFLSSSLFKPACLLAVFALAITLAACGGGSSAGTSVDTTDTTGGNPSVAVNSTPYAGDQCPNGGITVETGIDDNGNGALDDGEVDETQIVCNGTDGTDGADGTDGDTGDTGDTGADGTDGLTTSISVTDEPVGFNCIKGGKKIEVGLDDNDDGVLDSGEVDDIDYVCNGEDGSGGIGYTSLQGTITLVGRNDHSGITVSLAGTGLSATSNAAGGYTLGNIPQGEYDIIFDAPADSGYETGATLYDYRLFADIDDYDLTDVDLQLGRGILLSEISGSYYYYAQISQDSTSVVYADSLSDFYSSSDLYSVPIGGGTPILLAEGVYYFVQISPDSTSVVYVDSSSELYSVPIGGGTPALLASGVYSYSVQISPDSTSVFYTDGYSSSDLYSVPIGGGTPALLASNVYGSSVQISPDSTSVVYADFSSDLYSVPIGGGTPALLASGVYSSSVQISPDSASVFYTDGNSSSDLYSVPIGGGTPALLASNVYGSSVQISPDSTSVFYTDGNSSSDLYSVPIGGGTPILLAEGVYSYSVQISPDSTSVVYTDGDSSSDLYSVPIGGGTPTQMASGVSYSVEISPDSASVVYGRGFGASTNYYNGYSSRLMVAPLP